MTTNLRFRKRKTAETGDARPRRRGAAAVVAFVFLAAVATAPFRPAAAEDADVRAERFDGLIESLNASSAGRARILEAIYGELRGPDGREMQETLREALSRNNTLILLGVVEAMAMLGDSRDVGNLETLLATTERLEVKTLILRLLPAFCLSSERSRFSYINYAAGYERVARPEILEPLRRPPLTRRGRLDVPLEHLRERVVRCLAQQFDPVAAALRYVDDLLFGPSARRAVVHYVGNSLGNDPGRWRSVWESQGSDGALRVPGEAEEIRLAALASLADMGAEGSPEVLAGFDVLFASGGEIVRQAAFDAMTVMCRSGFDGYSSLASMEFGAEDSLEGESWRGRLYSSTANLAVYAAGMAGRALSDELDGAGFISAVDCLGAALSYPEGYPDPDGRLAAARGDGQAFLERLLMRPDLDRERRTATANALGGIGTAQAVSALASVIDSPYCSPEAGADGARMADAVIDALRLAATGGGSGSAPAREALLALMNDGRVFPALRAGTPPVGMAHMVLWRLQRLARSTDINPDPEVWRLRLGW